MEQAPSILETYLQTRSKQAIGAQEAGFRQPVVAHDIREAYRNVLADRCRQDALGVDAQVSGLPEIGKQFYEL